MYIGLLWIYCNFNKRTSQYPENLVQSLIKQLYERINRAKLEIKDVLDKILAEFDRIESRPNQDQCLQLLINLAEKFDNFFIVIDALDEFREEYRKPLINNLRKAPVKLLITSRNLPVIKNLFGEYDERLDIKIITQRSDLKAYIDEQIKNSTSFCSVLDGNDLLKQEIIDTMIEKYNGT
jgi:hypothetical protein